MASQPGEIPDFDFDRDPQLYFDHIRVAQEVIAPLVDHYFPIQWDENAKRNKLGMQIEGEHHAKKYDAVLGAYNFIFPQGDERFASTVTLGLSVEEIVQDDRRSLIAGAAIEAGAEIDEEDFEGIIYKTGTAYAINGQGDIQIITSQDVEDVEGNLIWTSKITSGRFLPLPNLENIVCGHARSRVLQQDDMERIEAGVYVLRAPDAIKRALELIRAEPITEG